MYGVARLFGLAFNLMYPVPTLPDETTTCPGSYVDGPPIGSPTEPLSPN